MGPARCSHCSFLPWVVSFPLLPSRRSFLSALLAACAALSGPALAQAPSKVATTTTLVAGPNTVASGSVVTLTTSVAPASGTVKAGQVDFCDAAFTNCTGSLGTAQITAAGTATLKLRPGIGTHSYKAVFLGTNALAGSTSSPVAVAVTGAYPKLATSTTISQTGGWGAYALSATVSEIGNTAPPTGTISFLDTNHGNGVLGTGTLGFASRGVSWLTVNTSAPNLAGVSYAVADLNNDGIPDLFVEDYFGTYNAFLGAGDGTFTQKGVAFGPSSQAGSFVLGDFNNDGITDVAAINGAIYAANTSITIFLGKGDGTFTAAAASPALGYNPAAIAVADVNDDGNADLIVVQQGSSTSATGQLVTFLGNGDGTFTQSSSTMSLPSVVSQILPADLNNDGNVDLVLVGAGSNGTSILLGNGQGTFSQVTAPSPSSVATVAVGDVNNDGIPDLICSSAPGYNLTVFLGNGDGTFTAAAADPNNSPVTGNSISIADVNQDGIPDLLYSNGSAVGTLFGKGDGTFVQFPASLSFSIYGFGTAFVAADFNGDGWPDVLAIDSNGRTIQDALTQPTETATASTTVSIPATGQHLVDASYPGDSNYNSSASGTLALWGVPPSTITALAITAAGAPATSVAPGTAVVLTATVAAGASPIAAGQVNFCDASAASCSDIHLLATVALSASGSASYRFIPGSGQHLYKAMFVQNGGGLASVSNNVALTVGPAESPVYTDSVSIGQTGEPGNYTLTATVQGFGGPAAPSGTVSFVDTSVGNSVLATATLGSATPGNGWLISQTPAFSGTNPLSEVTGDFNLDGIPDLAVLWANSTSGGPYSITIFTGNGDGTFSGGTSTSTGISNQIYPYMIAGDFNGDGRTDLAVLSWNTSTNTSYVTTLLSNGDGTFAAPKTNVAFKQGVVGGDGLPGSMAAADFNGDGKLDIAVVGDYVSSGGVAIIPGNGDGTFQTGRSFASTHDYGLIATGDFNGDGIPDLVVTNYFEFGTGPTVFLGKGDGTFTAKATSFTLDYFPTSVVVGDFNGDGVLDLAFSDLNGVEIALGNGDGTFHETPASPIAVPSELYTLQAGDFNQDGKLDLVGLDNYNDRIVLLAGAGDGTFAVTATNPAVSQIWLGPIAIAAADFNSDGAPDLAMLTKNVSTASILLTVPTETATATASGIAPPGPGTHNVDASYAGDSHYAQAVSPTISLLAGLKPLVISPAPGTYTSVQTITLSEPVPGATIYYEAFGALSTSGFVAYTGPIAVSNAGITYIDAYATETGYQQSDILTAVYNLALPPTATPVISPAGGYYAGAQTVTLADATPGAKIYYTTNGSFPTANSTLYTGPVAVSTSQTLVATAIVYGDAFSSAATAQYIIGSSPASLIYTIAGTGNYGYTGDGGPATSAELDGPAGVVRDGSGNIYFSDDGNHVVRKVAAGTGIITRIAGTGTSGYSGDGGPATSAELTYPVSLAMDSLGNLFIADDGNGTVRKLNLTTGIITTYAGNPAATASGDGGQATAASLYGIEGIALDASRNLYISGAAKIREVNDGTGIITTIAGTGLSGFSGDGGVASNATFYSPAGLAFDASGNLYVADRTSDVVRKISAVNGVITPSSIISTVAGVPPQQPGYGLGGYAGDGGPATSANLNDPIALAADSSGNLYITDTQNGAIRKVTAATGIISTVVGNGVVCGLNEGDSGSATSASLCYPWGIAVDATGNIYIADESSSRVREAFAPTTPPAVQAAPPTFSIAGGAYGAPQTVTMADATPGASIYVTVDGTTPMAGVSHGYSFPITLAGTVTIQAVAAAPGYLTSAPASATYTVTSFSPIITTVAGNGKQIEGVLESGNPALDTSFGLPQSVAVDKTGNLYVADRMNNVLWLISASSGTASVYAGNGIAGLLGDGGPATSAELNQPQSIALDSAGNVYVADTQNNVIRKVDAGTGIISTVAGERGYGGSTGSGGPATSASLLYPAAIALDRADNLYIADTSHSLIRMVSAKTGIITTVAGNGSYNFSGDGGPATSAGIPAPNFLAVDKDGNIYLGTTSSGRIRKVTASTGIIATVAGVGDISGHTGDGGPATSAQIGTQSIAVDSAGNLYLSESPGTVREVDAKTGVISKVAGIGFGGFSGDGGAALAAMLLGPYGLAFNASGDLYIADSYNYRIRKVTFTAQPAATPTFSVAPGTYSTAQTVSISDTTPGAVIYYTTDGSTPTSSSALYSGPLTIASSETISAFAAAPGYSPSPVVTAAYVISAPVSPSPSVTSLSPAFATAGGSTFTLTVNGSGFSSAATVYWGSSALTTQYVSAAQLTAQVPASNLATAGAVSITVQVPPPGGGTSIPFTFEVDTGGASAPPVFATTSITVTAGQSATYPVTLPSSATNVSVRCLNVPAGAACSYSASAGTLTITTTASTPPGTYPITVVFTETLPGAAALILLPLLFSPRSSKRNPGKARFWIVALLGLLFAVVVTGMGCGGGSSSGNGGTPPPQTHQATSSGTVTLIVK